MPRQISGQVALRVGIKTPQGILEQVFIRLAQALVSGFKITGLSPACIPYSVDFSSLPSPQNIDLSSTQLKNQLGTIKAIFVDNSDNDASVTITMNTTLQQIIIPGGFQGYVPVANANSQFQVETAGDAIVGIDFLNVDVEPCVWSANPSNTTIGSILFAGSSGTDHSTNQPAFPPAGLTLLSTVPANTSRALIGVQYQDANQCQIFMVTDGGAHIRILLESGGAVNTGGGVWSSQTFKGELLVYGTAGDEVSVYEN